MNFLSLSWEYWFAGFMGIYLFVAAVFFGLFLVTNRLYFKTYMGLATSNLAYILIVFLMTKNISLETKANLMFPLACFCGTSCFWFFWEGLAENFYLKDTKFYKLIRFNLVFMFCFNILSIAVYFSGYSFFFIEGELAPLNFFLNSTMGKWHPKPMMTLFLFYANLVTASGNIYLALRLSRLKLSGYNKLIYMGIAASFLANINDNLMAMDIMPNLFPLMYTGYLFESVYFLIASLRYISESIRLKKDGLFIAEKTLKGYLLSKSGSEKGNLKEVLLHTVKSLKKLRPELAVTVEANLDGKLLVDRKEKDLAVVFYHLLAALFKNIEASPLKKGHISIWHRDGFDKTLMFSEDTPSRMNIPGGSMGSVMEGLEPLEQVADSFGVRVIFEPGAEVNTYSLKM